MEGGERGGGGVGSGGRGQASDDVRLPIVYSQRCVSKGGGDGEWCGHTISDVGGLVLRGLSSRSSAADGPVGDISGRQSGSFWSSRFSTSEGERAL